MKFKDTFRLEDFLDSIKLERNSVEVQFGWPQHVLEP